MRARGGARRRRRRSRCRWWKEAMANAAAAWRRFTRGGDGGAGSAWDALGEPLRGAAKRVKGAGAPPVDRRGPQGVGAVERGAGARGGSPGRPAGAGEAKGSGCRCRRRSTQRPSGGLRARGGFLFARRQMSAPEDREDGTNSGCQRMMPGKTRRTSSNPRIDEAMSASVDRLKWVAAPLRKKDRPGLFQKNAVVLMLRQGQEKRRMSAAVLSACRDGWRLRADRRDVSLKNYGIFSQAAGAGFSPLRAGPISLAKPSPPRSLRCSPSSTRARRHRHLPHVGSRRSPASSSTPTRARQYLRPSTHARRLARASHDVRTALGELPAPAESTALAYR